LREWLPATGSYRTNTSAIPLIGALPGRQNLVLTGSKQAPFAGMQAVSSLEQALALAADFAAEELCVIGGAQIYALTVPYAQRLYLTHVDTYVEQADTWFPQWDETTWKVVKTIGHRADEKHAFAFSFVDYQRATPLIS